MNSLHLYALRTVPNVTEKLLLKKGNKTSLVDEHGHMPMITKSVREAQTLTAMKSMNQLSVFVDPQNQ